MAGFNEEKLPPLPPPDGKIPCLYSLVETYPLGQPYGLLDPIAFMGIRGGYGRVYRDVNMLLSMKAEMHLI